MLTNYKQASDFEADARKVAQQVRGALAGAFDVVQVDARRPIQVSRRLGLERNLGWKVCKIITESEPLAAISSVAGRPSQAALLDSLRRAGVPHVSVRALEDGLDAFERMVAIHAGERETLDRLLAGLGGEKRAEREKAYRKQAFQGNSVIWGVQTRVRLAMLIVYPDAKSKRYSTAIVTGFIDFQFLRSGVSWPLMGMRLRSDAGGEMSLERLTPIDPGVTDPDAYPALREFCSPNMPPCRATKDEHGVRFLAPEGMVGLPGKFTCVTGFKLPCVEDSKDSHADFGALVQIPAETLQHDMFMHESLASKVRPEFQLNSALPDETQFLHAASWRNPLPVAEELHDLGTGLANLTTPDVHAYPKMVETVLRHLAVNPNEFRCFRFAMQYPPMPSRATFRYPHLRD